MTPHRLFPAVLLLGAALPAQATTLDEAIAAAMTHAPDIAAAQADADGAQARVREAQAGGLPSVTVSGSIGYGRLDPRNFFGLGAADVTPRAAQVTVEQPLFAGGRVRNGIAQARAGSEAARIGEDATRSQIVVAVAQAYGDALTSRRLLALQQDLLVQTTEIERQARLRYKAGESPSTDVSQAAARFAEAQAGIARAQGLRIAADARFTSLTGLPADDLQPFAAVPDVPATLDEAMEAALARNPWLGQARAALRGARAGARAARGERLPTVGAFAEGGTVRDQFFPGYKADSAMVGVRARWSLFDPGVAARIDGSDSAARAAQAREAAVEAQVREQVIAAFQDVRTAALVEAASARQAQAALQARDSVAQEVRVGMKPQLDLLDAEREATAAAAAQARAGADRIVAAYRLLTLMGRAPGP